jgi:hypothetical protein
MGSNLGIFLPFISFQPWLTLNNSTCASILAEYKINASTGKKVDYACYINPEKDKHLPDATKLIDKICASAIDNSVNHTSFQRLLDRPISFSIETKRGAQTAQKAELQMGV